MSTLLLKVAKTLGIEPATLEKEALHKYLLSELTHVTSETRLIMTKYGVSSIKELDEKIKRRELIESNALEDLTKLDYLLDKEEKIRKLLNELEHT